MGIDFKIAFVSAAASRTAPVTMMNSSSGFCAPGAEGVVVGEDSVTARVLQRDGESGCPRSARKIKCKPPVF